MRRSITYSVLAGLALAAVVVVIVAIGGGGDGDNGNASAANTGAGSGLVSVQNVDGTNVLVDSEGKTLYSFAEEGSGQLEGDGFVDDFQGTHFEWAAVTTGARSAPSNSNAPSDNSPY